MSATVQLLSGLRKERGPLYQNRVGEHVRRGFLFLVLVVCVALAASCGPTATSIPTPQPTSTPAPTAIPTESAERYHEPSGGFSYIPPAGWEVVKASTLAYKVAVGPETDGFAANLTIVDEPFDGSLDEYVSSALDGLGQYFESFQVLSQEEFTPEEGAPGVRIVAENMQGGRALRQSFYLFDTGTKKYVVTCTRLAGTGAELDAVCEGSVKTLRFESE